MAAALCAAAGLGVTWTTAGLLGGALFMFQFAAVVASALHGGFAPGLFTAALCGIGFHRLFYAPGLQSSEAWRLASFAVVSVLFAWLAAWSRRAKELEREARVRAESAWREAERAEEAAKAIAALQERLVAVVSHDLRSPLTTITMSAGLLERSANLDERQRRIVSRIAASAGRMESLVTDLLDFARSRHDRGGIPVRRVPAQLGDICRRVLDELRAAHAGHAVVLRVAGDDAALVDPQRVEQIVGNLVANALRYGAADRPIEVVVAGEADGPVRLEVRNEGPPVPRELMPALFEAFRAGGAPGSVGLGLFIVREIALAHGGGVSATSDDRETRFVVTFPRGDAKMARA